MVKFQWFIVLLPIAGEITVKSPLDREVAVQHNLTVMVSDQGVSPNRNFTRVTINILDHNDHPPVFLSKEFSGRVFETAALGTSVLQVTAVDQDKGRNAEVTYSIQSGRLYYLRDERKPFKNSLIP